MAALHKTAQQAGVSSRTVHIRSYRTKFLCRADGPKVVREYREDDGAMYVNSDQVSTSKDGSMYVDPSAPPRVPRKKDNLSKEMKQRLREEYIGLGGAENKAMSGNLFLNVIVFVAVLVVLSKLTGAI